MTDMSDLTYEYKRPNIVFHIYTINSIIKLYKSSINQPNKRNNTILDELANCIKNWVDETIFDDFTLVDGEMRNIKGETGSMPVNDILKTDKSIKLYTVNAMNMIRCAFNDELKTTLQQNDRGRKIDDFLNK